MCTSRAHALSDCLDRAALARAIAAFEHDADLGACSLHPNLKLHEPRVQARFVVLAEIGELLEAGRIQSVIDKVFPSSTLERRRTCAQTRPDS
jgi:hypothetical protein